jgi:acylpyruvate hydrolase
MEVFRISDKGEEFRPGKLLCIGRNYAKHAKELGNAVPEQPMVFLKPASSLIPSGQDIVIPDMSNDVHHEVELVCLIGTKGKDIAREEALEYVAGYAVGLDMTARDIQSAAKAKGHPWSVAKGFDTFAPIGDFISSSAVPDPQNLSIQLSINAEIRQSGQTSDMIFPVAELISWCSSIFTLMPGDLLFTGTPEGVGPIHPGDALWAHIEGLPDLHVGVRRA